MAKNATSMIVNKFTKITKLVNTLTEQYIYAGVPSDKDSRIDESEVNNAILAYINDRGSPANNIPARPFMEPGIELAKDKINAQLKKAGQYALDGKKSEMEQAFHRAGLIAQNSIRSVINAGIRPELAPGTLAARRRAGKTRTKPLIDTGQLRNSIIYAVRRK